MILRWDGARCQALTNNVPGRIPLCRIRFKLISVNVLMYLASCMIQNCHRNKTIYQRQVAAAAGDFRAFGAARLTILLGAEHVELENSTNLSFR